MAIEYRVYFKIPNGDWINVENTDQLFYKLSNQLRVALDYFSVYQWRVDVYNTETESTITGDTWTFISQNYYPFTEQTRRSDYNEDYVWNPGIAEWDAETEEWNPEIWNPETEEWEPRIGAWVDINDFEYIDGYVNKYTGGGRYNDRIIAIGHNCIYYGDA